MLDAAVLVMRARFGGLRIVGRCWSQVFLERGGATSGRWTRGDLERAAQQHRVAFNLCVANY